MPRLLVMSVEDEAKTLATRFLQDVKQREGIPSEANYRPSKGRKRCGNCRHYATGECRLWDAVVSTDWVCDSWSSGVE